jgi:propionyl-CoA carboxylase alpha chain
MGDGDKAAIEMEVLTTWKPGNPLVKALVDNKPFNFKAVPIPEGYRVWHRGCEFKVAVRTPRAAELAKLMPEKVEADTSNLLLCPMPGVIVSVLVEEGQEVQDGQALAIVEAMKMENTLRAEKKSVVSKINAKAGDNLAVDEVIMEFVVE